MVSQSDSPPHIPRTSTQAHHAICMSSVQLGIIVYQVQSGVFMGVHYLLRKQLTGDSDCPMFFVLARM